MSALLDSAAVIGAADAPTAILTSARPAPGVIALLFTAAMVIIALSVWKARKEKKG